ncbi:endonuclease G [Chitinophaga terrae (ex Kim and Jung 2007)]|uniref:DNA/RNA non-specific endonuclease n=1 Tax=Chitinophaga terrae (ex Kim and Jung 2007) TaxID=408074 RepID=UPI002781076C|nr:DNA/RNA non-specific endonuclease [Chitinophaga terrae (ex Kim and Jung 2007)]MDQ0109230.1 endonuclease G [Chitinophaga terrae (ex Kim and Jung 2007)]
MPQRKKKGTQKGKGKGKGKQNEVGYNSLAVIVILAIAAFVVSTCNRQIVTGKREPGTEQPSSPKGKPNKKTHKKENNNRAGTQTSAVPLLLKEDFERGHKTNYNSENVELKTGRWSLKNAVLGNGNEDKKIGKQSLRLRDNGTATMNFDINYSGAVTVTVKYAMYGSDEAGEWELLSSSNRGQRFIKVGETVKVEAGSLRTATFVVNADGNIRFQVRKTSREGGRINLDMLTVEAGGKVAEPEPGDKKVAGDDDNLLLGNPSGAASDLVMANNYLMDKEYYQLSYNREKATPNWVSWHVDRRDIGKMGRANNFRPDFDLPANWYQVSENSYKGSGFDRGHNCPSGDRTFNRAGNEATFLMSNMIPQAPNHNQHLWKNLEEYTRELVMKGNEVYIVMGSYGSGGTGANGSSKKIDRNRINVPSHIWKVILVLPDGGNDLKRISKHTRIIAVNTPNRNDVNARWSAYLTSISNIEQATGYKIFDKIPDSVRQELVKKIDTGAN